MRIAILGTRGIPNHYGGFEQLAEYLSVGLVQRGHEVYVYQSSLHPYKQSSYQGVELITCIDPEDKMGTAGQFVYDLNCIRDARKRKFDVLLQLGYTSSSVWYPLLPSKTKIITNMDGMEWKRSKYNALTQRFLKMAERWAIQSSDLLVADSTAIQSYIHQTYKREATYIAYGAEVVHNPNTAALHEFSVSPQNYDVLIARFEPENNIECVLQGFMQSEQRVPLLLIGSTKNKFGQYLTTKYRHPNLQFLGPVYDIDKLNSLRFHSRLYFHGHTVGGTNPSLLEAMASSATITAHQNEFNRAVLGDDAYYFTTPVDVASIMNKQEVIRPDFVKSNREKIATQFSWNTIIDKYETLFKHAIYH